MSGVGGKSGTPPIGHGPNAVVRSTRPREDKKNQKKHKSQEQLDAEREGHDEFAVQVDASLFHLDTGDIIEGHVTGIESEKRLLLDSQMGSFRLQGSVKLEVGAQATIRVVRSDVNIEGVLVSGSGIQLTVPIPVIITPIAIHTNPSGAQSSQHKETLTYSVQKRPASQSQEGSEQDAALLINNAPLSNHISPQVHSPKITGTATLSQQDLSTIIAANTAPTGERAQTVLKAKTGLSHNDRPSMSFFFDVFSQKFPEQAADLKVTFNGTNGHVPNGLTFFLAGLIFSNLKSWLGNSIYNQMLDTPALKGLQADFDALQEVIYCLANEKWRLVVLPHPEGGKERAIQIISNIQTGNGEDGTLVDMRTLLSQLDFNQHQPEQKPLGKLQIEATLMPHNCSITLRFDKEVDMQTRVDLERLVTLFLTREGIQGHILFAPFTTGHLDFQAIANSLNEQSPTPPLST